MENFETDYIINHLGEDRASYLNSGSPPVFLTSLFAFPDLSSMREALQQESTVPFYSRGTNPGLQMLEAKLAALEGGEAALLFASGSAAIAAAVSSQVSAGDHVVCVEKPYSWTGRLLRQYLSRFGVSVTFTSGLPDETAAAFRDNTRVLYLETPNSFTFGLQDIAALSALARPRGIRVLVDNSYCTPLFQKPLSLGADIVIHSASKYLSGHSDAVGGVLVCSREDREKIFASEYMTLGGIMSPMNAWLILRGLRTLSVRLRKSHENGMAVAAFLAGHRAVEQVSYPFHPSHPQYELARRQMEGAGGLMSFTLKTRDMEKIEAFTNHLRIFLLACSWGSYESLCFPAAALQTSANYSTSPFPPHMFRIYCGLEESITLIRDLENAFFSAGL